LNSTQKKIESSQEYWQRIRARERERREVEMVRLHQAEMQHGR
jgi:hypothetical protein